MGITVGTDTVQAIATAASTTMDSVWPLVALSVGVPLAFYLGRRLLSLITPRVRSRR